ncbi:TAP-like protein-domain-containing protein [Aspergillus ambiguus]|uniref:alpha/beta hydrolase n=1 Tax=Aspergillus ambiguus TaxID=176160 RepID=UPI003CCD3F9D
MPETEKPPGPPPTSIDQTPRKRPRYVYTACVIAAALCLATVHFPFPLAAPRLNPRPTTTDIWSDILPSTSLEFTPCFGSLQCARLLVPLNWNATQHEEQQQQQQNAVAIAVIKRPARVPITDPRYGGAVILNPGGPGESGVYQVLSDGAALQTVLDSDSPSSNSSSERFYDIVSFDPRGVNNTTPRLRCFPDAFAQQVWYLGSLDYGLLWDSERVVGLEWARAEALGASCARGDHDHDPSILQYVNTAQTVEDMLHLVEKLGEWRGLAAQRLLRQDQLPATLAYRPGHERLQYWGVSYGTVIGTTFAAMHPERVGRIVLDGVVDPADHYAGGWLTQLQDSDAIVTRLSEYCFAAGPQRCALHTGTSGADVERRFTAILRALKDAPLAVDSGVAGPALVTYEDVHLQLLSGMYFPYALAEPLFRLLPALESRNASAAEVVRLAGRKQAALVPAAGDAAPPYVSAMGAVQAIACMDSLGAAGGRELTRDGFRAYLAELQAQGRWISPSWARNKIACVGFPVAAAWRPALTFRSQEWAAPAHPLLVVGNSHDTVTPLRNARRVASMFPGSVVVQQDSEGHCSHSMPSLCTARIIREYMRTGTMPAEGTVCAPDARPFVGCSQAEHGECQFQGDDRRLWEALVSLADPLKLQMDAAFLHL